MHLTNHLHPLVFVYRPSQEQVCDSVEKQGAARESRGNQNGQLLLNRAERGGSREMVPSGWKGECRLALFTKDMIGWTG